ncbi:hypothetical protein FH972_022393 [Carpinus fangiana]|uniref:FAD-binding domain-containing protein n=1 Tax=Carpinus fangiana TaxID=176857 RepID=A0A5N6KSN6_9ROSI|nr:hypothetical protein FH972_022393 [Carpinus fangiana]
MAIRPVEYPWKVVVVVEAPKCAYSHGKRTARTLSLPWPRGLRCHAQCTSSGENLNSGFPHTRDSGCRCRGGCRDGRGGSMRHVTASSRLQTSADATARFASRPNSALHCRLLCCIASPCASSFSRLACCLAPRRSISAFPATYSDPFRSKHGIANMVPQEKYDIVIVGAGPVGLLLSTCLARWGYKIKHIDNRVEPTKTGRADGIQPRSLDLLRNMGLKSQIMAHKPARVFEVAFWDPSSRGGIARSGTWPSCPKFIDARYPFTTLLHQGLIERVFIADMEKNGAKVQRPWTITDFKNDGADPEYPVEVKLASVDATDETEVVRAKYLFSGEGGRSFIREKLGIPVRYKDPIAYVWGVMDGVVKTDFPDIKMKCTIHSDAGSIMVIPREDNMVRLYIQIASSEDKDFNPRKKATAEEVQEHAKNIFKPYSIEWESIAWYSVYPIGQGISERYTLDERVLMGGDACHTHSPKAGQGMNTAFLDAQNLAWKIHHVESGFAPRSILKSYESERKHIAENLLDFDSRYAKLFSQKQPAADDISKVNKSGGASSHQEENAFIKTFKESCEFTSGYGVAYQPNIFNWSPAHPARSPLFLSYPDQTTQRPGRILTPATVTRVADANTVHLEQELPLNGAWRIYLFAGAPASRTAPPRRLAAFAEHSLRPASYLTAHWRADAPRVSHHEQHNPHSRFVSFCTVFAAPRAHIEVDAVLPPLLARYRQHVYADDLQDLRVLEAPAAAHAKMGLSPETGGVVVVRPDGYVGCVLRLSEDGATVDALNAYFGAFTTQRLGGGLQVSSQL